jgi:platelet-activating factor acetylhydrolase
LAADFFEGKKKLVPVIFSHGLSACALVYTVICKELASYGLMVVAMDYHDGSCGYTRNAHTG